MFLLASLSLLHLLCCSHNILGFRDLICVLFCVSFHAAVWNTLSCLPFCSSKLLHIIQWHPQVYPISHLFQGQSNGGTKKNARVRFSIPLLPQCAQRWKPRGRDIVISIYHFFNPTLGPRGGTIFDSFNATVSPEVETQIPRHSN
ncbi:hypothetical protein B0H17DRAFT_1045541 [Mycena rosella]|uniref:Secreted protein n=1 Tax=Mycena rosella TaxID=1033263 RepID=A0AAD7GPL7_MYCRO|nr:hypothetical protein B0H17DRAFT_1045541 [Mycena rosella]